MNLIEVNTFYPLANEGKRIMSHKKIISNTFRGDPVPPDGFGIIDDALSNMLSETVLGWSPETLVMTTFESPAILDFRRPLNSIRYEDLALLDRNPSVRHLYLAVGVSSGQGQMNPFKNAHDSEGHFASHGDHYVALYVDVSGYNVILMDSLPTAAVTAYIRGALCNIALNVYGSAAVSLNFFQANVPRQPLGSNECGVHVWRNIACALTTYHEVPAFRGVNVVPTDVCRDVFRAIYNEFFC